MQLSQGADASNILQTAQKRLIRVVEGQTQATPYAGYLDPTLRETSGTIRIPLLTDKTTETVNGAKIPLNRGGSTPRGKATGTAFTYQGSLTPGLCLVKNVGESLCIHNGEAAVKTFGLLGQWIGGTFDGIKSQNEISAWLGLDSVYDLLAPAWNDEGLAGQLTEATAGVPTYLFAGIDGRLCGAVAFNEQIKYEAEGETAAKKVKKVNEEVTAGKLYPVAEVVERPSAAVLRIKLLV